MKKILITLLVSYNCFSQKPFQFYNIDGTEIVKKENYNITIKYFEENYFPEYKHFYSYGVSNKFYDNKTETGVLAVFFQEFSNKPIFILGNSPTVNQIKKAINSFDYNYYLKTSVNYNLKNYIQKKELTIEDLYSTFGRPNRETNTSTLTFFHYNYPYLDFTIKDGIVIDFVFIKPD